MSNSVTPARIAEALGLHPPTTEQAAVIAAPSEPALVVAGAGAGKTETMAARVLWLVACGVVEPEHVLGLTFTRKAARQLADRIRSRMRRLAGSGLLDELDPSGQRRARVLAGEPTVLTYHAYASRLIAEHGLRIPVEPGARLLSPTMSWQLAHRVVSTWTEDIDTDKVPATVTSYVLALAAELAEHLVSPERLSRHAEEFSAAVENAPRTKRQGVALPGELRKIVATQRLRAALMPLVRAYSELKRTEGAMDFADQMSLAARLATEHPEVAAEQRQRYGAVLLDEYQDTGHAQRVLLRALFGGIEQAPLPVTSVGDPAQAIYGWRGASAANLPRFKGDFPRVSTVEESGRPARRYGLLTSFRNPPDVLRLANRLSVPLRAAGLEVDSLRARDGAVDGDMRVGLFPDIRQEREWIADRIAALWQSTMEETGTPPTAAVLLRRRSGMAEIAAALRERGLPVEVVGIGGLLDEPEVRDLVSALRLLVDPLAGTAAMRLLTGSRWRIGAADLGALAARAAELAAPDGATDNSEDAGDEPSAIVVGAMPGESTENAGLADAIDDPGEPRRYSEHGYRRIRRLGGELSALRRRLDQPLPELVADVERTLLLDIECMARPDGVGKAHLDAFAEVVADFASASPSATLPSLLDYLASAESAEDGLEPGEVEVAEDRVQVLTVHAAKGLEWEIVAVPHLVEGVFPPSKKASSWLGSVSDLPAELRGDAQDLPRFRGEQLHGADRKEVAALLESHEEAFDQRRLTEERRLLYVAVTRSERALLVSGYRWPEEGKVKQPSQWLTEIADFVADSGDGRIEQWAPEPEEGAENPLGEQVRSVRWPVDPLGARREAVVEGADMVRAAMAEDNATDAEPKDDPDGWARDVDVLLAERATLSAQSQQVELPTQLSVSQLVELATDQQALAARLRRPLPAKPNRFARRGTAFHAWVEQQYGTIGLLDYEDLVSEDDHERTVDVELEELQRAFLRSAWSRRTPYDVEVPFDTEVDGFAVRGRMDAVFRDSDGGWTVVDWKTGAVPPQERMSVLSVQLAAYRLAWAAIAGCPLEEVRAAFHYVRDDRTVRPVDLLDADGLRALLRSVPQQ